MTQRKDVTEDNLYDLAIDIQKAIAEETGMMYTTHVTKAVMLVIREFLAKSNQPKDKSSYRTPREYLEDGAL